MSGTAPDPGHEPTTHPTIHPTTRATRTGRGRNDGHVRVPQGFPVGLVGRDAELAELVDLLGIGADGAAARAAHGVLLAGDAGVGKTRMLTELRDRAVEEGWHVVAGHALDFGDAALPYLPFTEVIGRLADTHPEVVAAAVERHPGLLRLTAGNRALSADRQADTDAEASAETPAISERAGDLFAGIHALLDEVAGSAPLLLVVEDLHWADRSTRDLLSFLLARPFAHRVAIVASYRADHLHRRHPLRSAVAEWARLPGVERYLLQPLAPGAVRDLILRLHPDPILEAEVSRLVDLAEGNPFFTEELVGATWSRGGGVPLDLAELLLVRLDQLEEDAQQVVRAASVAGKRVSHQLLAAVTELPGTALEVALRNAVERSVLVAVRDDAYAFRHALLREAVYDDLLPGERIRSHAAFARALSEGGQVYGTPAELARHARASRDLATALQASITAGDDALQVGGAEEAAQHFEAALGILVDPSWRHELEVDRGRLTKSAADALANAGHLHRALALIEEQLAHLPGSAPPDWRIRMLVARARVVLLTEGALDEMAYTREALEAVGEAPSALRVRALDLHAQALGIDFPDEARRLAEEAAELAEGLGLPAHQADVATTLLGIERSSDPEAVASLEQVTAKAEAAGDGAAELRARYLLGRRLQDRGDLAQARGWMDTNIARAEELRRPWAPFAFASRWTGAMIDYVLGDWDRVLQETELRGQAPPEVPEKVLGAVRVAVLVARGEYRRAARIATVVRDVWQEDPRTAIVAGVAMVEGHALEGDLEAAVREYDDVVATVSRVWSPTSPVQLRMAATLVGLLAAGVDKLPAAEQERRRGLVVAAQGRAHRALDELGRAAAAWGPEGLAWRSRLAAEVARFEWLIGADVDRDALVEAWQETVQRFDSYGHVYETARCQAALGGILRAVGDSSTARAYTDPAREAAHRLGAAPLLAQLQEVGSAAGRRTPRDGAARAGELTPREEEILALVADGRSNGEIGKRLFISTKTVSVHVSNILGKLGASSRGEAAALARREGLLE